MEKDTFYIHRILHEPKFYDEEVFLCESRDLKNEFYTIYVNSDSGKIFESLKSKFENKELSVLPLPIPLCAVGYIISAYDFIPVPNFTKRAIDVEIIKGGDPDDLTMIK